ncbi:hypothetical protein GN244_ATG02320 [Phytophthora infestans]|uniref:Uncharacterized protein n=1 Tax=Phytophthora infestans TaxID=4787 RepID=A0A833X1B1_PHYIN|nr:hypothetical protein GN244_ATG02320 [Phytophthora infestans]
MPLDAKPIQENKKGALRSNMSDEKTLLCWPLNGSWSQFYNVIMFTLYPKKILPAPTKIYDSKPKTTTTSAVWRVKVKPHLLISKGDCDRIAIESRSIWNRLHFMKPVFYERQQKVQAARDEDSAKKKKTGKRNKKRTSSRLTKSSRNWGHSAGSNRPPRVDRVGCKPLTTYEF